MLGSPLCSQESYVQFPFRDISQTLKFAYLAFLLGTLHKKNSTEKNPTSSLVSLGKALTEISYYLQQVTSIKQADGKVVVI